MARVGSALNNAVAEAVHRILKVELAHRRVFATREQARRAVTGWITEFYSLRRRHSACGQQSPIDYEHQHHQQADRLIAAWLRDGVTGRDTPSLLGGKDRQ